MNNYSNVHIFLIIHMNICSYINIRKEAKILEEFKNDDNITNVIQALNDIDMSEDTQIIDEAKVKKVKEKMPKDELLFDLAELFKVFGDSTRMKIICALLEEELCVGDIAVITNSTPSAISHQLRVLKQAKLVKYRKEGKSVFYSLDDDHVKQIFEKGREHIEEA